MTSALLSDTDGRTFSPLTNVPLKVPESTSNQAVPDIDALDALDALDTLDALYPTDVLATL
jgi:hypothetical protein